MKTNTAVTIVAIVLAVATIGLYIVDNYRGFSESISDDYSKSVATKMLGDHCVYGATTKPVFDRPLADIKASIGEWKKITLPYGPEPLAYFPKSTTMVTECEWDLGGLPRDDYAELSLGPIYGTNKVFINGKLRYLTKADADVVIPLVPDDTREKLAFTVVGLVTETTKWPGFSGYYPMLSIATASTSKAHKNRYAFWTNGIHQQRFTAISSLLLILLFCYLMGMRYPDVLGSLILGSYFALFAWLLYAPVSFTWVSRTQLYFYFYAGTPAVYFFFARTFFRTERQLGKTFTMTALLMVAFCAMEYLPQSLTGTRFDWFRYSRLLGSLIFLWMAVKAVSLATRTKGVRKAELSIFAFISLVTCALSVVTVLNDRLYGFKAFEFTDYYTVLTCLTFHLIDLGVFHQRYLREAEKTTALRERGKRNQAIVDAILMLIHDLKRPFFVLKAMLKSMAGVDSPTDVERVIAEYLPAMDRANESAVKLISGLAHIQSVQVLTKTDFSFVKGLRGILKDAVAVHQTKALKVHVDLKHGYLLHADEEKILRALQNLYENAIHATPDKGRIDIASYRDDEQRLIISVKNSGSFIPREKQEKVFDLFYTTKGMNGSGLGLAIVRSVAESHAGSVKIDSDEVRGTEFSMQLPASILSASIDEAYVDEIDLDFNLKESVNIKSKSAKRGRPTIVVIDDDPFVLDVWQKKFRDFDCALLNSSAEAIAFFENCSASDLAAIRLVVCDYYFQDDLNVTGFELTKHIRSLCRVPILIVSQFEVMFSGELPEHSRFITKDLMLEKEAAEILKEMTVAV